MGAGISSCVFTRAAEPLELVRTFAALPWEPSDVVWAPLRPWEAVGARVLPWEVVGAPVWPWAAVGTSEAGTWETEAEPLLDADT